jgi:hypothetical protein
MRVVCGLVAATLAVVVYGLVAQNARAGAPQDWQPPQVAAVPPPTVELYPTDTAPATAQPAAASEAKSPQMVIGDQGAVAETSVAQNQPTNVVVSIRIDSPGDNGPISQTNDAVGAADGTNDASTTQDGAPGGTGQDASTNQQAAGNTTVTQDGAGNYVVTVRINSPGNNGPVSQTNAAVGTSNAQNTSETNQGSQSQAPAPKTAPKKAGCTSSHPSHRRSQRRVAPASQRWGQAATPASAGSVAQAPSWHGTAATTASAARPHHATRAATGLAAQRRGSSAKRAGKSPFTSAIGRARDLLGAVTPRTSLDAARRPADVSSPVLSTLLAALAVGAAFVAWSLRPAWRRQRRFGRGLLR